MDLCSQIQWQIQGEACRQRMYTSSRDRLWRNLFTGSKIWIDWPWSSSQTFQTWLEPDFEPGVQESGSAEYLNLNLLAGSGSSSSWTQTWGSNLEPQPTTTEINEPTHTTKVAVPSSWWQWLCPSLWSLRWWRWLQPGPLWLRPLPGGYRIRERRDWNRSGHSYGPEGQNTMDMSLRDSNMAGMS